MVSGFLMPIDLSLMIFRFLATDLLGYFLVGFLILLLFKEGILALVPDLTAFRTRSDSEGSCWATFLTDSEGLTLCLNTVVILLLGSFVSAIDTEFLTKLRLCQP